MEALTRVSKQPHKHRKVSNHALTPWDAHTQLLGCGDGDVVQEAAVVLIGLLTKNSEVSLLDEEQKTHMRAHSTSVTAFFFFCLQLDDRMNGAVDLLLKNLFEGNEAVLFVRSIIALSHLVTYR